MNRSGRIVAVVAAALGLLSGLGCNQLRAREQLNQGVRSFKADRYEEAVEHFKSAVSSSPNLPIARLYLGTAYMQMYLPGAESAENKVRAQQAIEQFAAVAAAPNVNKELRLNAIKRAALLYYHTKDLAVAKNYYQQATQLDANDPETYYMLGVLNWTEAYKAAADVKAKIGLKVESEYSPKDLTICEQVKQANAARIAAGINALQKSLALRPNYEEAMVYMNLLYRRKADIECSDPAARQVNIATANEWSERTLAARKLSAQKQTVNGITLDQSAK
jgi:tetratricopeptide (TPR) repeat protein